MKSSRTDLMFRFCPWLAAVAGLVLLCFYRLEILVIECRADEYTGVLLFLALGLAGALLLRGAALVFRWRKIWRWRLGVAWVSLCLVLFVADLIVRYGDGRYSSYSERMGAGDKFAGGGMFLPVYTPQWKFAVDWGLTILQDESGHLTHPPNLRYIRENAEFSYSVSINNEGLRDRSHPVKKEDGELRILCLGDSFTQGVGASFEHTWPQQLAGILPRAGHRVRIINGGMEGSDLYFMYRLLKTRLLKYRPDIVVVALNTTDLDEYLMRGGMERFLPGGKLQFNNGPWWQPLYASSYLVRHVIHALLGYDRMLLTSAEAKRVRRTAEEELGVVLQRFKALSSEAGFKLLVAFQPMAGEVDNGRLEMDGLMRRLQKEGRIPLVDLLGYFMHEAGVSKVNSSEYFWPMDSHNTPKGYGVVAKGIAAKLQELGWVR